ncbi:Annexin D5 [Dendrobium catenatum]|uniref:Annexin D5 n=1 Tax=Dendrobium catenatum TaxID=906689 RepID=A0A2I0WB54_9ASPA|nr:Annexin D5 [Dendrobium catenatum]
MLPSPSPCEGEREREMATLRVPLQVPSAKEDAMNLWMACQGREADEKTLIDILAHRDEAQRLQIIQSYEDLYHENLIKKLENELSGELKALSFGRPDLFTSVLKIVILSFISPHKYFEKIIVNGGLGQISKDWEEEPRMPIVNGRQMVILKRHQPVIIGNAKI